jgi:hypothetical protein
VEPQPALVVLEQADDPGDCGWRRGRQLGEHVAECPRVVVKTRIRKAISIG